MTPVGWCYRNQKQRQRQRTGVSVPHGQSQEQHQRQKPALQASEVPTSRKGREKWGTPYPDTDLPDVKSKNNVKSNGQECPFHTGFPVVEISGK
jgi:hypothetical protein